MIRALLLASVLANPWFHNGRPGAVGGPKDFMAPVTTLLSGPSGVTGATSATFTFSASEPATFMCTVDLGTAACTSPATFTGLSSATGHTFSVRATDGFGNVETSPPSRSWTIGLVPLPCDASTSCDMHFVADDWSGSGSWTSRDSNHWVAAISGSAPPTGASSQFPGRLEIGPFATTKYFVTAASGPHAANGPMSIEIIGKSPSNVGNYQAMVSSGTAFNTPGAIQLFYSTGQLNPAWGVTDSGGTQHTAASNNANITTGHNFYLAATVAAGSNHIIMYLNADSSITTTLATMGTFTSSASLQFFIGTINGTLPWSTGGTIIEILRHQSELSSATITSRYNALGFSGLKGY